MKGLVILLALAAISSRATAIAPANDGAAETGLGTAVANLAAAQKEIEFVPGQIIVKIDPEALPMSPVGDTDDAWRAAASSTLAAGEQQAFRELIDRHKIRFTRALFLPRRLQPGPGRTHADLRVQWSSHVDAVRRKYPELAAAAPEIDVPDLSTVYMVEVDAGGTLAAAVELAADPHVIYAEPDFIGSVDLTPLPNVSFIPNDRYVTQNQTHWAEGAWGQTFPDLWGIQRMQVLESWNLFPSPANDPGRNVLIGDVDTGLDFGHPDISANVWINPGEDINGNGIVDGTNTCPVPNGDFNCVDNDSNGYIDDLRGWNFFANTNNVFDDNVHGTHTAGTFAARRNNTIGITGIAPNSRVLVVKAFDAGGSGPCSTTATALRYAADRGAGVINNSWGLKVCSAAADAAVYAYSLGRVVIVSAGNDGRNAMIQVPANVQEAITIGAYDQTDQATVFTNFGSKIDVVAPGGGPGNDDSSKRNMLSLAPNVIAGGCLPVASGYCRTAGTSMSGPHVTGLAALIRSLHPTWNVEQIRQAIRMSADDADTTGWDGESGFGRANSLRALSLAAPPTARLMNINHEQSVAGVVSISGQIGPSGMSLTRWTLSYRRTPQGALTTIQQATSPAAGAISAQWNVSNLPPDTYVLQLEVVNTAGQIARDTRRVFRSAYQDVTATNLPALPAVSSRGIRAADVDGDGDQDIFTCYLANQPAQLLINNGTGQFTDQSASRLPAARSIACGDATFLDVERDGDQDLYISSGSGPRLWINNGSGTFADQTSTRLPTLPATTVVGGSAAADIDGDNDTDLINTTPSALLINNGAGVFSNQTSSRMPWFSCTFCGVNFVDIDRDNDVDVVCNNAVGINNGAGVFSVGQGNFGDDQLDIATGDVTGDGYPDVLVSARLFVNNGAGGFPASGQLLFSNGCNLFGSLHDIDADADLDVQLITINNVVGFSQCHQQAVVLLNNGGGQFSDRSGIWGFMNTFSRRTAFVDVTGEGYADLLVAGLRSDTPSRLFQSRWDHFLPGCVGDCGSDIAVTVDEIVRVVNILLGLQPIMNCRRGDADANGEITCAEVNRAINNALSGCSGSSFAASISGGSGGPIMALSTTVTQQIGTGSARRGQLVTIPITVSGGAGAVSATQLDLLYPTNVVAAPTCTKATRLTNHSLSTAAPSTPPAPAGKARRRALIADLSEARAFTDGTTFSCSFPILATAPLGTHTLTGERARVSDSPGNELGAAVTNGSITVQP